MVEPQFCRNEEFEPFAFIIDEEGLPVLSDMPKTSDSRRNDIVRIVEDFYPNGIERVILIDKIQSELGITYGCAQVRVTKALKTGRLVMNGKVISLP